MQKGDRSGLFALQPSRIFLIVLTSLYLSAVFAIMLLPIMLWAAICSIFVLLGSYGFHLYRDVLLKSGTSCLAVSIDGLHAEFRLRNGAVLAGKISGATLVTPVLTAIHMKPDGSWKGRTIQIFADSLPVEDFRKLRVLLKWGVS